MVYFVEILARPEGHLLGFVIGFGVVNVILLTLWMTFRSPFPVMKQVLNGALIPRMKSDTRKHETVTI